MSNNQYREELIATAKALATPGKGILAADESTGTIGKRFDMINVENNVDNRQKYRQLLFRTEGLEEFISGTILYDETIRQSDDDGVSFPDVLRNKGIVVGIKVDKGAKPLLGTDGETFTQGLDGLGDRCKEYYDLGARFAKWRAILRIGPNEPSNISIIENCNGLARYAAICQENGLVPIVEPEVLMDGEHDLEVCIKTTQRVLAYQFYALQQANILLEGTILKCNMVCPGKDCQKSYTPQDIGQATVVVLQRTLPVAVPGVNFLSGGLSEEQASQYLNAMNQYAKETNSIKPWNLSFSFGRALQQSCLKAWLGKDENIVVAQEALLERAKANSEANLGVYQGSNNENANESLFVSNYTY
eukprot:TRINITY_DN597_c0_g1_i1.p1 TRINITY_DN597_c0_g1~~TRINITY_DN597_c0_g1_i1.p1  ORF type:complete len:360 (+),score=159.73 TRINITY_DN597_c0_g1_i1:42-1121(+)